MPIIKSAIKKMKQDKVRTARNKLKREHLRDIIKSVEDAAKNKDSKVAELFKTAQKMIDKADKWNLLQSNNAARKKSRLAKLVKSAVEK